MSRFLVAPTGHSVPLPGGEMCVGSDATVQIPVRAEMGLMPRHFVIAPRKGGWELAAVEGAVVSVNGLQVLRAVIHDGDQIVAGQLALTYRDEQEAARARAEASVLQNSFPSLHPGLPQVEEAPAPSEPPPVPCGLNRPPSLTNPMIAAPSEEFQRAMGTGFLDTAIWWLDFYNWGAVKPAWTKRSMGIVLLVCGALSLAFSGGTAKKAPAEKPTRLTEADIVIVEGRIIEGAHLPWNKAGEEGKTTAIYAGRFVPGTTTVHKMPIVLLPDDLSYIHVKFTPASVAKFGFLKKTYNREISSNALHLITLEVDGKVYRSLAAVNAAKASAAKATQSQGGVFGGACLVFVGLLLLVAGGEKGKT